jgi:hypothetical protein
VISGRRIAAVLMVTLFTVGAAGLAERQATGRSRSTVSSASPASAADPEPAIDLYGNEVIDAVATYKLDRGGSLYEEHSPQTEVPHLKSPKS